MARIQMNAMAIERVVVDRRVEDRVGKRGRDRNSEEVKRLIIRMFIYSAMKINAKPVALYSTLKPETNSDSPSAKSKGVRFVSAKIVIIHINMTGYSGMAMGGDDSNIVLKSNDEWRMSGVIKISAMLTS